MFLGSYIGSKQRIFLTWNFLPQDSEVWNSSFLLKPVPSILQLIPEFVEQENTQASWKWKKKKLYSTYHQNWFFSNNHKLWPHWAPKYLAKHSYILFKFTSAFLYLNCILLIHCFPHYILFSLSRFIVYFWSLEVLLLSTLLLYTYMLLKVFTRHFSLIYQKELESIGNNIQNHQKCHVL